MFSILGFFSNTKKQNHNSAKYFQKCLIIIILGFGRHIFMILKKIVFKNDLLLDILILFFSSTQLMFYDFCNLSILFPLSSKWYFYENFKTKISKYNLIFMFKHVFTKSEIITWIDRFQIS